MHPAISKFPASEFYNLRLRDGTVDSFGNIPSGLRPPVSRHLLTDSGTKYSPSVVFLDHAGSESKKDRSWVNVDEAHIVCSLVEDLLLHNEASIRRRKLPNDTEGMFVRQHLRGHDIGIIAPYVAQISLLTRLLNADVEFQKRFKAVLGDHRAMQLANIDIKTVDGFEGREKDVIIFSTVRNNTSGHIGFLGDRRRLNVGLTRAKRGLFVVGSLSTLKTGKVGARLASQVGRCGESLRRYARFLSDEGLVVQLYGDKLQTVLYGTMTNSSAGDSDKFQKQTRKRLKPVGE
jgi:superfamily I DNA and/or RNA helicase